MPSRRRRFRARPKPAPKRPPINDEITAREVRLVDVDGTQLGIVPTAEARQRAAAAERDLVLVAEKATPPVARILDIGKYIYERRKKLQKQKALGKGSDVKGVRIGYKTGEHDLDARRRLAEQFLAAGHKVKLEMRLRGRERARTDIARQKMRDFIASIPGGAIMEDTITFAANALSATLLRPKA